MSLPRSLASLINSMALSPSSFSPGRTRNSLPIIGTWIFSTNSGKPLSGFSRLPKPLNWKQPPYSPATLARAAISSWLARVLGVPAWMAGPPRGLDEKPMPPASMPSRTICFMVSSSSGVDSRL